MKLTATTVQNLKPADRRQEIPDDLLPGLYLIVQPTGKKAWQVRYRHTGTHRRMKLADYPVLSLAAARERAREIFAAVGEGRDPAKEVKAAKAPKPDEDRDKISKLVEQFDKLHLSKLRSGRGVRQAFDLHVIPAWGDKDIHEITRRDIVDLLDSIANNGKATMANRVRAYLSKFFNWAVDRAIIDQSPALGVKAVAKEKSRDRVLSDDEIKLFWRACDQLGEPWGPFGKALLLTGQRVSEVAGISDRELSGDLWQLPSDRTKNKRAHSVPLPREVRRVLAGVTRLEKSKLYFTTTGETPISGFSKGHGHIVKKMAELSDMEIDHWTFHDLRRTVATGMARIGIPVRVTEAVLNHVSGTGGGIVAVYQRHDYADEKRNALEAWARLVAQIVEGKADNVVSIAEAKS